MASNNGSNNTQDPIKVIFVGEAGAVKTNLINVSAGYKFNSATLTTRNCSFVPKTINLNNTNYNLNIWDTIGQEKFHSLTKIFLKESDIAILVYDITNKKSFDNLTRWVNLIKENINTNSEVKGYLIFLMGTKSDIANEFPEKREVEEDDAIEFCNKQGLIWKGECSSKNFSDENYKKIFSEFAKELYEKFKSNKSERVTVSTLQKKKTKPHRRNCHC